MDENDLRSTAMQARAPNPSHVVSRRGFTLVEIMVVVIIIGLLTILAMPAIAASRDSARAARFINDLRQAVAVFEAYSFEIGTYPPDGYPSTIPSGMEGLLDNVHWEDDTPIGGQWDWDLGQFGVTAGVSVYGPEVDTSVMQRIDARIDDGNLATGVFRQRSNGYIYVLAD